MRERTRQLAPAILALLGVLAADSAIAQTPCPGMRALNGACANMVAVEDAQIRAMVISTVRSSYFGTPIGTVGGKYIPFERLFQDNALVFGLPTYTIFFQSLPDGNPAGPRNVIVRTK